MKTIKNRTKWLVFALMVSVFSDEYTDAQPNEYSEESTGMTHLTGGYVQKLELPDGIEKLVWPKNKKSFELHFSVDVDSNGIPQSISSIEYDNDKIDQSKEKYANKVKESVLKWRFSSCYDVKNLTKPKNWSFPMHVLFERNKYNQYNIVIRDGNNIIVRTNTHFERFEE